MTQTEILERTFVIKGYVEMLIGLIEEIQETFTDNRYDLSDSVIGSLADAESDLNAICAFTKREILKETADAKE